jgi:ribonuclease T1
MRQRLIYTGVLVVAAAVMLWGPKLFDGSSSSPEVDADSGLAVIAVAELPDEAVQTLELIDNDGPFPYEEDGGVFGNNEGLLPDHERGYYHEYTVETPGSRTRGALRIVTGSDGEFYWTDDHYQSFERIQR